MGSLVRSNAPRLALVNDVLACNGFDGLAADLLPRLTSFFRAGSSCAFEMRRDGDKLHLGRAIQIRMPKRSIADYAAHFVDLDPVCAPAFGTHDPRGLRPNGFSIVRLSDRCPRTALLGSEYYNDFLREIDIQHVFGLMVRPESDPARVVVLGFHRPRSERDFSIELDQATALAPSFRACVERMCYRSRIEELEARDDGAVSAQWVMRFDRSARLIGVEGAAGSRRLFRHAGSGAIHYPALLEALERAGETIVIDRFWQTLLADLGIRGVACGRPLRVRCTQAASDQREFELRLAAAPAIPRLETWAQQARLSAREIEVTRLVVSGLRNSDVAGRLGLSLRTVENHLRSIFSKAGVRSRTQLLYRLVEPARATGREDGRC